MLSIQIPTLIQISKGPDFITVKGPKGVATKLLGTIKVYRLNTIHGRFLFVDGAVKSKLIVALAQIYKLFIGVLRGSRRRLRLSGVGFRATRRNAYQSSVSFFSSKQLYTKNYRHKRIVIAQQAQQFSKDTQNVNSLTLKIGYSHECTYPFVSNLGLNPSDNQTSLSGTRSSKSEQGKLSLGKVNIQTSRLEGRTKGRLISIQGQELSQVNQIASEIRSFRKPDVYKGKGILYDKEVLRLKKGKRQALDLRSRSTIN